MTRSTTYRKMHVRNLVSCAKNALYSYDVSEVTWKDKQPEEDDFGRMMEELRMAVRLLEAE